jgi:hypothetical protein
VVTCGAPFVCTHPSQQTVNNLAQGHAVREFTHWLINSTPSASTR